MANFANTFTKTTTDCRTLILIDTSTYGNNDDNIGLSDFYERFFEVRDGSNVLLATLPLTGSALTANYQLGGLLTLQSIYLNITLYQRSYLRGNFSNSAGSLLPCIL